MPSSELIRATVAQGKPWPGQIDAGSEASVRASAPRVPVARVMMPTSSLKATTLGAPCTSRGSTRSRIMHSILVRKLA